MDSGLLALFVLFPKEKEKKKKTGNLGPKTTHSLASLDHKQLTSWKLSNLDDMSPCYILVASSCYREDFSGARRGLRKETPPSNLLGTSRTSLWDVDTSSMWDPRKGTLLPFRERTNCYLPLFPAQPLALPLLLVVLRSGLPTKRQSCPFGTYSLQWLSRIPIYNPSC